MCSTLDTKVTHEDKKMYPSETQFVESGIINTLSLLLVPNAGVLN